MQGLVFHRGACYLHLPTYDISKCMFFADDLKIYLKIRHSNIVDMSSDLSSCQRDIDNLVHAASSWRLQFNAEKNAVLCVLHLRSRV